MKFLNFYLFLVLECGNTTLVGDGSCNDETNTVVCNYDGGDCCLNVINKIHCSECVCYFLDTCIAGFHPLVGDGFCNDETNIADCNYDGGDCCGNVKRVHCVECTCNLQATCTAGFLPVSIGDGFCNDENNVAECSYDHGDCCLTSVNTDLCSECSCSFEGVITSPKFPQNYVNNLDMTWLIQLPLGQFIEIVFVNFNVDWHNIHW